MACRRKEKEARLDLFLHIWPTTTKKETANTEIAISGSGKFLRRRRSTLLEELRKKKKYNQIADLKLSNRALVIAKLNKGR